jgi:hypothetical protein
MSKNIVLVHHGKLSQNRAYYQYSYLFSKGALQSCLLRFVVTVGTLKDQIGIDQQII